MTRYISRYAVFLPCAMLCILFWNHPAAGQCNQPPQIGSTAQGIEAFPEIEETRAVVQYDDVCQGERWTKVWLLEDGERPVLVHQDGYDTDGWRTVEVPGLKVNTDYCVAVETPAFQLPLAVKACFKTIYVPRVDVMDPVNNPLCGNPQKPSSWQAAYKEHIYLSQKAAQELGINPALVSSQGPSPQVRLLVDKDKVGSGHHPSAVYTVAGICANPALKLNRFWVWETSKLFGNAPPALPVRAKIVSDLAPHRTNFPNPPDIEHYTDPNAASKHFQETIDLVLTSDVLVMAPHGGHIETGTSDQIPVFQSALTQAGGSSSYWDVSGKWGAGQTYRRWHVTSTAIHPLSFPGLGALMQAHGQYGTAVAFHGCSTTCNTQNYGVVIGGGTARINKCHVAQRIETLAQQAGRGGEMAYLVATDNNQDINLLAVSPALDLAAVVGTALPRLRGTSPDNIVNRVSGGNGIQLEQTQPLRNEDNCGATCLKDLVARGTALAVQDMVNGVVPAGACQF